MTKREFTEELCRRLKNVPADEANAIVNFYVESIEDRIEEGMDEEAAVAALGSIDDIVRTTVGAAYARPETEARPESGESKGPRKRDYVVDAGPVEELEVHEISGDVEIEPSHDNRIHVHVTEGDGVTYQVTAGRVCRITKSYTGKRDSSSFYFKLGNVMLIDKNVGNLVRIEIPAEKVLTITANTASGDFSSSIRKALGLKVTTGNGDIDVEGLTAAGELSLSTGSGDMEVTDCAADRAAFRTGAGDVQLNQITANEVAVTTSSGDVSISELTAREFSTKMASGDLEVEETYIAEKLTAASASGDMDISLEAPLASGSFEATNGDITLELYGREEDYRFSTRTLFGDISCPAGSESGAGSVRCVTVNGDIEVTCRRLI